jgi:hypothetical protein
MKHRSSARKDDPVRILLQADEEWSNNNNNNNNSDDNQQRQRKKQRLVEPPTLLSRDELLQYHIRSMLAVDRCLATDATATSYEYQARSKRNHQLGMKQNRRRLPVTSSCSPTLLPEPTAGKNSKQQQQKRKISLQRVATLLQTKTKATKSPNKQSHKESKQTKSQRGIK